MSGMHLSFRATASVMVLAIGLAGCQTTGTSPGLKTAAGPTTAEEQLQKDAEVFNDTVGGGVATGAVVGAVLGVLLGAATGNSKNMVAYGLAGAAAGGIMGGVDGYMTAKAQESSNNQVRMLASIKEDVEKDNNRLRQLLRSSNTVLAESKEKLDKIKEDVLLKKITLAQAEAERQTIQKNQTLMASTLKGLSERRDRYQEASAQIKSSGGDTRQLDSEINQLQQQVSAMENMVSSLNTALEVSRVG